MSTREILPPIYSSGIFKLDGKLTSLLSDTTWYTCIAIRKIEEIESLGIDCYNEYYTPIGLDEEDYKRDADFNACIITLKSSNGQLVHFPSTYLKAYPNGSGVLYSVMGIAIELGPLPIDYNLSTVETKLKDTVRNTLGITPRTRLLTLSNTEIITQGTHERLTKARQSNIESSSNLEHLNKQLTKENTNLKERLKQLEQYVVNHIETIKSTPIRIRSSGFTI